MKKLSIVVIIMMCAVGVSAQKKDKKNQKVVEEPTTVEAIVSYALGANIAESFKMNAAEQGVTIDWEWLKTGITETSQGKGRFDEAMMSKAFGMLDSLAKDNQKKKSVAQVEFLENNKKNQNVKVTPSGLQYEVITMGEGAMPKSTDQVTVHYEGKTIDGKVFDSSYNKGEPVTFGLNQVIKGWTEGLQLMPVGSKFRFFIPSELAYGERGAGGMIQPYATLIFEIELIGINMPKEEKPMIEGIKIK